HVPRLRNLLVRSGILARLPAPLQAMEWLAPRVGPGGGHPAGTPRARGARAPLPPHAAAPAPRRRTVGLRPGCVQGAFFPDVNAATVRVLAAEGCDVLIPPGQGCCGALSVHNGPRAEAQT